MRRNLRTYMPELLAKRLGCVGRLISAALDGRDRDSGGVTAVTRAVRLLSVICLFGNVSGMELPQQGPISWP